MEEPVSPLILTKVRVPAVRAGMISRARLDDLLASEIGARFILVCAPAGYGKTTLLAEWAHSLQQKGVTVAWYSLDAGDNTPSSFGSYLVTSLAQSFSSTSELASIAQLLRSSPEIDLHKILPSVINAIASSDRAFWLILDDYHLISAPAIHTAIGFLIEHTPENLHVVLGSRSNPPLPLARLRARGQLIEVRASSLRFTRDETAQFLNKAMRLDLSPEGVAALEERTEGWVAGLQLAALSLADRTDKESYIASFTGSHRYLVEYLMEEVVNRQPEEVRSFLLATSILERLCTPLCDQILGDKNQGIRDSIVLSPLSAFPFDSQAIIEYLEKSNLFLVPLDDERTWYRYHHLFRDFLHARLDKIQPELVNGLHRAACEWLAAHSFLREAADHAFHTHDWEYAAAFVEHHSFSLIVHSDISTIYEWCSAFPEEVIQRHPMLCLQQGLALAYRFRRQNRSRVEARLQQADQVIAVLEDRQLARSLIDLAGVVRTFLAFAPDPAADARELLSLAQSVLSSYSEGDPARFSGLLMTGYAYLALQDVPAADHAFETARQIALRERLYFGIVESTFHLACLAHSQGQLHRAAEICRLGQADVAAVLAYPEQELPALGSLDIELGCVLLEQDQLEEAEKRLRHGLELMGGGMNPYYLMKAYLALFRLSEIQGRPAEAVKYLDRLEAAWPDIAFCTQGSRVKQGLRIAPKDPDVQAEASAWCRRFASSTGRDVFLPGTGPFGAAEAYYLASLTWAQIQIALGNPQPALAYLQRQLDRASANGLKNRVIELSVLLAIGFRAEGQNPPAWAALEHALLTGQPEGYLHTYDQGPALTLLLVEAARQGVCREYIESILSSIGKTEAPGQEGLAGRPAQTPFGESLSERELEVLRLIAQGATNHEIARQLVITEGTVKSHINHILVKLNAHNRTEAVAHARGWGIRDI